MLKFFFVDVGLFLLLVPFLLFLVLFVSWSVVACPSVLLCVWLRSFSGTSLPSLAVC